MNPIRGLYGVTVQIDSRLFLVRLAFWVFATECSDSVATFGKVSE